ncbi:cupin domain-containing protein [Flavitalea flava]
MAYKNKIISNPVTKQDIHFLQTSRDTEGRLLEMEATYHGRSKEPVAHYHPFQEEDFRVITGELTVKINGKDRQTLKAGDRLHIPSNQVHSMWNAGTEKTIVNWQVRPAMDTENLLETMTGLAVDGKTNESGMPPILQIALTAGRFGRVLRLSKPPFLVQKVLFSLLKPIAYLSGYKPVYKKYLV